MKLAFTVCTNSHLAQAKTMADSLVALNPTYKVAIGVVDKLTNIDVSFFEPHQLVEIEKLQISNFEPLLQKYSLLEMSCLAKPYFANYFLDTYPALDKLIYFDSDIVIYDSLKPLEQSLEQHDIILTPHTTAPFGDTDKLPPQRMFLNSGLYNGGFFAVNRSDEARRFLDWWAEYVSLNGYVNFCEGMFVDQLCLNFVPLFFKNVLIETNAGYNVAYWNFHERKIVQKQDGKYWVNDSFPLLFFHYSGYRMQWANRFSLHQNRHQWDSLPELWPLFQNYHNKLTTNRNGKFSKLPNAYFKAQWYDRFEWLRGWTIVICRKILKELNG